MISASLIFEVLGVIAVMLILFVFLWILPGKQVAKLKFDNDKDRFDAENTARDTLSKLVGGVLVLLTILISFESARVAQESARISQQSVGVTLDGQFADRFTKAVDLLARQNKDKAPALESRVGGLYALERIAQDSDRDYWPTMEAVTAYVRMNSPAKGSSDNAPSPMTIDVQTALTVIGRRKHSYMQGEDRRLDLTFTNLTTADCTNGDFQGALFNGAKLNLIRFNNAHLEGANFRDARFDGAILEGAHFEGADLSTSRGLSPEQLAGACLDQATKLPQGFENGSISSGQQCKTP